jgi:hypothetical protein
MIPFHISIRTDPRIWLYLAKDADTCHFYTNNSAKALRFDSEALALEYIAAHAFLVSLTRLGVLKVHHADDRSQLVEVKHMRYGLDPS